MASVPTYRVSKNADGRWQVKKDGSKKALRVFDDKNQAISFATITSQNQNGIYIIDDDSTSSKVSNLYQNTKKPGSKPSSGKVFITIFIGIIIGIIIGFVSGKLYFNGLYFELLGHDVETISLNQQFIDPGYIATYDQVDISDHVEIEYKKTSGETVDQIDPSIACSYLVIYTLDYQEKNVEVSLVRTVTVDLKRVIETDNLSIHFLELGNKYTGDSIYIKAGETDILIDAGSRKSSAGAITNYLNQYIDDGILEYVIATHAHQDHIAGFVGTSKIPGIFSAFKCEVIIDYPKTNATSTVRKEYEALVANEVALDGATHYNALECWNEVDGAQRSYQIASGITLNILYNYYYENDTHDENDYSVCVLISEGENHYLFTGDLEASGEEKLVEYNELPVVTVYKAGHHGSKTSSSSKLLEVIRPQIVCVCCCAGSTEYTSNNDNTFPTQDFISRVKNYTDQIYVTTMAVDNEFGYTSFNGTIVVSSINGVISVNCTNNNLILKDTDWFKKNRKWE